jgi:hypothetical protein
VVTPVGDVRVPVIDISDVIIAKALATSRQRKIVGWPAHER